MFYAHFYAKSPLLCTRAACSRADIIQKGAAKKVILVQRRQVYYNFSVREIFAEIFRPLPQREEKMSENENITSPGVPESESGSASLSEESAAVPCSSADDATLSDAPLAEGGGAEEEGAGAPEEEAEKGPETYIVTADGIPVGGTAYRRGNAILNFIKSVLGLGQKGDMVPGGEKISYYTYFAGQNLIYALVSMFLTTFAVMQGMDPEKVAVVMLAVKIWDAVNDAFFGTLFDKIKFKSGNKFMPWLRMSVVAIPLSVILRDSPRIYAWLALWKETGGITNAKVESLAQKN